jgi:RNA polymerase sigma-70 factor, ECF subfamily
MRPDTNKMFLEAYDAYADAIYRHCYFRVYSRARAEELMQETFMKTWQYVSEGKKVNNIRAFLYRVANNLVIDESRRKKEDSLDALMEDNNASEPSSDEHIAVERRAIAAEIRQAMNLLNPEEREILILRYVDDLEPKEIAEVLDLSPNAVSVRIHRATQSLKVRLNT